MAFDRFMISPMNTGLESDVRPYLIPEDAFTQLQNAYVFRGRVRKRFGSILSGSSSFNSRLGILLAMQTDGSGNRTITVPGIWPNANLQVGIQFVVGTEIFTVTNIASGANSMMTTGVSTVHTFDTSIGQLVLMGAAATTNIYMYLAQPVMGLTQYLVGQINNYPSFAFDTEFAYQFVNNMWLQETSGTPIWHGTNKNYFWSTNWSGFTTDQTAMFVTNFNATIGTPNVTTPIPYDDPVWYYSKNSSPQWGIYGRQGLDASPTLPNTVFTTSGNFHDITGNFIYTARIILPFKNRLIMLNTIEQNASKTTNTAYTGRCRFSHLGSPFASNAWLEPNQQYIVNGVTYMADGGGYIDAATEEAIVSAEFIKDRLIVYFERSTWELAWTGNQVSPFTWNKINTELGSESTFSTVPFDKVVLTIGNTGVHGCSGANTERIDNKIPDIIFNNLSQNPTAVGRVAGIRDYYVEQVYWTLPSNNTAIYADQVLVYNYKTGSWAINDDVLTCFGYFQQQTDNTWATSQTTWEESGFTWNSAVVQQNFRNIVAGTPQGAVITLNTEIYSNAPCIPITAINAFSDSENTYLQFTIVDHTMYAGDDPDYFMVSGAQGMTEINGYIFQVQSVIGSSGNVVQVIVPEGLVISNIYTGGGYVQRVSNVEITSKEWNPYLDKARNFYLARIDFGVVPTAAGQITVDYYISTNETMIVSTTLASGVISGTSILETYPYPDVPFESGRERLWHPIYFNADGECVQVYMYMTAAQMTNTAISLSNFEMDGLALHCMQTSYRLQ